MKKLSASASAAGTLGVQITNSYFKVSSEFPSLPVWLICILATPKIVSAIFTSVLGTYKGIHGSDHTKPEDASLKLDTSIITNKNKLVQVARMMSKYQQQMTRLNSLYDILKKRTTHHENLTSNDNKPFPKDFDKMREMLIFENFLSRKNNIAQDQLDRYLDNYKDQLYKLATEKTRKILGIEEDKDDLDKIKFLKKILKLDESKNTFIYHQTLNKYQGRLQDTLRKIGWIIGTISSIVIAASTFFSTLPISLPLAIFFGIFTFIASVAFGGNAISKVFGEFGYHFDKGDWGKVTVKRALLGIVAFTACSAIPFSLISVKGLFIAIGLAAAVSNPVGLVCIGILIAISTVASMAFIISQASKCKSTYKEIWRKDSPLYQEAKQDGRKFSYYTAVILSSIIVLGSLFVAVCGDLFGISKLTGDKTAAIGTGVCSSIFNSMKVLSDTLSGLTKSFFSLFKKIDRDAPSHKNVSPKQSCDTKCSDTRTLTKKRNSTLQSQSCPDLREYPSYSSIYSHHFRRKMDNTTPSISDSLKSMGIFSLCKNQHKKQPTGNRPILASKIEDIKGQQSIHTHAQFSGG